MGCPEPACRDALIVPPEPRSAVLTAILSRAAFVEAARQQAAKRGDAVAERALQRELSDLRTEYQQAQGRDARTLG